MPAKKKILTNIEELRKIVDGVAPERKSIADSLFNEIVFMQSTLDVLKEQVTKEGPTAMFKQGAQEFLRERPALKAYNTTIQRYSLIYKQLVDLLPEAEKEEAVDPIITFIGGDRK